MMAKPMPNIEHNSNCSCCGKQSSYKEMRRKPSGFGSLQSAPLPIKSTSCTASKPLERASTEVQRRKSLQHGNEANEETSPEHIFNKISSGVHVNIDIVAEIAEDVVDRSMVQAKESRLKGIARDKESLLEECFDLKNAVGDQHYHLQLHKVHRESVDLEQRRMEIAIEELEVANGLVAPRTGGPSRLKTKLLGLKCKQQEYFSLLTTLRDDLTILRKDPLLSLTNEADVERDVFATETRRLQKLVRRLRTFYHKVCVENNEVICLQGDIAKLTIQIKDALTSLEGKKAMVDQMKKDISKAKLDALESQKNAQNANYKARELDSHSTVLKDMLMRKKSEGRNIHKQTSSVWEQTCNVQKENKDGETARMMAKMTVGAKASALATKDASKGGIGSKRGMIGKVKEYSSGSDQDSHSMGSHGVDSDSVVSISSKNGKGGKHGKKRKEDVKKIIGGAKEAYLNVEIATTKSLENVPTSRLGSPNAKGYGAKGSCNAKGYGAEGSPNAKGYGAEGSPNAKGYEADGSPNAKGYGAEGSPNAKGYEGDGSRNGNSIDSEPVKIMLKKDVSDAERFLAINDNLQYESPRPRSAKEKEEDERLVPQLEAARAAALARVEALARLKEEEARKIKDVEEAQRQATTNKEDEERMRKKSAEEEARKKVAEEEARKNVAEEEARKKVAEEEARKKVAEEEARKKAAEEEARKKAAEEARKRAAEEEARKKAAEEEARKKATEEEARKKAAEETRKKATEEEARKRAAEEEARKKAAEEARKKAAEEEARKKATEEEARKKAAKDAAKAILEAEATGQPLTRAVANVDANKRKDPEEATEAARLAKVAADAEALAEASESRKDKGFFDNEMQEIIKTNIKEVLGHLETISETVQQKASTSRTVESTAKDKLEKLDKP